MLNFYIFTVSLSVLVFFIAEVRTKYLMKKHGLKSPKYDLFEKVFAWVKVILFCGTPVINILFLIVFFFLGLIIPDEKLVGQIEAEIKRRSSK